MSVGSTRGFPGQTATVPFYAQQATNIVAAQFDLAYNTARGTLHDLELAGRFGSHVVRAREVSPGVRRVLVYSRGNELLRTNGFNGAFDFDVPAGERVGSGPILPRNVVLAKADATALSPVATRSGTVFVTPVYVNEDRTASVFFDSVPERRYLIQATTNFARWENIATNVAFGNFLDLVDLDAPRYPYRFYRSSLFDAVVGGQLGAAVSLSGGQLSLRVNGLEGRTYTVQASTNLRTWIDLGTVTPTGGSVDYTTPVNRALASRFFRLKSE